MTSSASVRSTLDLGIRLDPRLRPVLRLWGVRERTAMVELAPRGLAARFGPMRVRARLDNIAARS